MAGIKVRRAGDPASLRLRIRSATLNIVSRQEMVVAMRTSGNRRVRACLGRCGSSFHSNRLHRNPFVTCRK